MFKGFNKKVFFRISLAGVLLYPVILIYAFDGSAYNGSNATHYFIRDTLLDIGNLIIYLPYQFLSLFKIDLGWWLGEYLIGIAFYAFLIERLLYFFKKIKLR